MTMITSNGKQPENMSLMELKTEKKVQKWFANYMMQIAERELYKYNRDLAKFQEENRAKQVEQDFKEGKITKQQRDNRLNGIRSSEVAINLKLDKHKFLKALEEATRLFVLDIEDCMEYHKPRPKKYKWIKPRNDPHRNAHYRYRHYLTKKDIEVATKKRTLIHYETLINRSGVVFQWDRKKLMQVAIDRGYFSDMAVVYAIEQELGYPKQAIKKLLAEGKFTWGQVLILGALFEMTPKEFCDTFLCGYFVEQGGEWRASYENIDKNGLLEKTPMMKIRKKDNDGTTTD